MAFWSKKKKEDSEHLEPGFNTFSGSPGDAFQFHDNEPTLGHGAEEVNSPSSSRAKADAVPPVVQVSSTVQAPVSFTAEASPIKQDVQDEPAPFVAQTKAREDFDREQKRIGLRRRFIGALVILVTLAVAAPFVLDNTPPPPTISIPLRVPTENGTDVAQLTVPGVSVAENAAKQLEAAKQLTNPPTEGRTQTSTPTPQVSQMIQSNQTVASMAQTGSQSLVSTASQPVKESQAQKEEGKKQEQANQKIAQAKAEEAKKAAEAKKRELEKLKETQTAKTQKGSYFVQVVATADNAKAQQMRSQIASLGLPAYTEQITSKGTKVTRVRVGPYKSAKVADEARAKLILGGFKSGLVQQEK